MINATCLRCGSIHRVPESYAGRTGRCIACRGPVPVPVPETTEDFLWAPPAPAIDPCADTTLGLPPVVVPGDWRHP